MSLQPTEPFETLRAKPQKFFLFGEHLAKSRAPLLLNTIFKHMKLDWHYQIKETDSKEVFNQTLDQEKCIGSAVTMPNKIRFQTEVDKLDEIGAGVGAINTVYTRLEEGKVTRIGTNTDTVGIKESFLQTPKAAEFVKTSNGSPGLVYGGGGASRSAVYALHKFFGCETVYVVNRDSKEVDDLNETLSQTISSIKIVHVKTPDEALKLSMPKLAVLCVPNFPPSTDAEKLARDTLEVFITESKGAVLEMCYNPVLITDLYKLFEANGWVVIDGTVAMVYQGLAQAMLWGGFTIDELPVQEVKQAILEYVSSK